ncbi:MAG: GntR family transcriptional regulator [Lachnospiraceae bacterium]|nr:GntR family transcriptional regulator [Lachnospiraceae bacterium]
MTGDAFRHQETAMQIVSDLREKIILGAFREDPAARELPLSEQYGVSRSTVRTALMTLEKDGLLTVLPNGRKRFETVDREYIADLCRARSVIEGEAAAEILQQKHVDYSELLALLGSFHTALEMDLSPKRRKLLAETNEQFHEKLVALSGNRALVKCREVIAPVLYTIEHLNAGLTAEKNEHNYYDSHRKILDLLMNRDPAAVEYIRYHAMDAVLIDAMQVLGQEEARKDS